jgi:hypothetical protein
MLMDYYAESCEIGTKGGMCSNLGDDLANPHQQPRIVERWFADGNAIAI